MISIQNKVKLEDWVLDILIDPLTKETIKVNQSKTINGILDLRHSFINDIHFTIWQKSQKVFENWVIKDKEYTFSKKLNYKLEIKNVKPVYDYFNLKGKILDVGGHIGTLREFLTNNQKYISIDPFIGCLEYISEGKYNAYKCLKNHLNFVYANAEMLPFKSNSFDYVHMRSVIDHFLDVDLSLKEAHRVLNKDGKIIIGLYVLGGKDGKISFKNKLKELVRTTLLLLGFERFKDYHMRHPTLKSLKKLVENNNFRINDIYWQPYWNEEVCYILAKKN